MFTILNRFRGTIGVYAKLNGLIIAYLILLSTDSKLASLAGIGYIVGELLYGWGDQVGDLTADGIDDDGRSTEELTIRGFAWFLPTLAPLYFLGISPYLLIVCLLFLSVGFPLACKIGYYTSTKFSFSKWGFDMNGGWEHQEVWYGLMQDIVLIVLLIGYF